jgi:hypothetical protein
MASQTLSITKEVFDMFDNYKRKLADNLNLKKVSSSTAISLMLDELGEN